MPKEFIDLQFKFATRVSEILNIPIEEALLKYTCYPIRIGVPFADVTEANDIWKKFIETVGENFSSDTLYHYYLENNSRDTQPIRTQYGCFSFDYIEDEKFIRIHFANNDSPEPGALSDERMEQRLSELKSMLTDVKAKYPEITQVKSASWLYNAKSFKRLFPEEFFNNSEIKVDYQSLGMWGQFIDKYGKAKIERIEEFLSKVNSVNSIVELNEAFPLKDIKVLTDIKYFYSFYKV